MCKTWQHHLEMIRLSRQLSQWNLKLTHDAHYDRPHNFCSSFCLIILSPKAPCASVQLPHMNCFHIWYWWLSYYLFGDVYFVKPFHTRFWKDPGHSNHRRNGSDMDICFHLIILRDILFEYCKSHFNLATVCGCVRGISFGPDNLIFDAVYQIEGVKIICANLA